MSTTTGIHNVVGIEHVVRKFGSFCTNELTITSRLGHIHTITLYATEPLTIPTPAQFKAIDCADIAEAAP